MSRVEKIVNSVAPKKANTLRATWNNPSYYNGATGKQITDDDMRKATEDEMTTGQHKMWSVSGDVYYPCEETKEELPSGQYIVQFHETRGTFFVKKVVTLDTLLNLPDSQTSQVIEKIDYFWSREDKFREHGFLWKRGILLWGPPGSGKTSCLQQLSEQIVSKGGLAVYCVIPGVVAEGLRILRRIEPHRPIVVMIEDIDAIIDRFGESDLLALLDGELQIDNVVFVATTNYPEDLDKRFVNRPSRFDEVIYIGMPSADARRKYILAKNPRLENDLAELEVWVDGTEDLSVAHIRELVVAVECLGHDINQAIDRLRKMNISKPSSGDRTDSDSPFGFMPKSSRD